MEKKAKLTEQKANLAHLINEQESLSRRDRHVDRGLESLAERLKAGSHAAAAELVDLHYKQIYLFMRKLGHSREASEDLTQESFLQAWYHIGRLRNSRTLKGWLYRIASNISKLYWRRHKGREAVNIIDFDVPDADESNVDKAGRYEQLCRLKDAVVRLPMKQREVIVLHYMEHLTISEAAEAAGIREGTFKSRLNRALEALREQFVGPDGEL